jgi:hypothetical protein
MRSRTIVGRIPDETSSRKPTGLAQTTVALFDNVVNPLEIV